MTWDLDTKMAQLEINNTYLLLSPPSKPSKCQNVKTIFGCRGGLCVYYTNSPNTVNSAIYSFISTGRYSKEDPLLISGLDFLG